MGKKFCENLTKTLPGECKIPKCKIAPKKFNHGIILKGYSFAIKTGLEQRDYAILYGSKGCVTLLYKNKKFLFPGEDIDCLKEDKKTRSRILDNLNPKDGDVIIISSSDDPFVSEVSAKNSALWTLATG